MPSCNYALAQLAVSLCKLATRTRSFRLLPTSATFQLQIRTAVGTMAASSVHLPPETERHARTIMVWPSSTAVWEDILTPVQEDIARIANAIVKYEPVTVLVAPRLMEGAKKTLGSKIDLLPIESDDLWARDTLPVFAKREDGEIVGIDLHFNGWGDKQVHGNDSKVAAAVLKAFNITRISAPFVAEGGALETDGQGTLLLTESSIVNDNRNPDRSRDEIEADLKQVLGVTRVIWVKGVKGGDITDAHIDALARFAKPGVVVLSRPYKGADAEEDEDGEEEEEDAWAKSSRQALEVLKTAKDAKGNPIRVVEIEDPNPAKLSGSGKGVAGNDFLSSYLNYYVVNGAVIVPKFGDKEADKKAQDVLKELYPGRDVVPVNIDYLAAGGGGIHCATHELIE